MIEPLALIQEGERRHNVAAPPKKLNLFAVLKAEARKKPS